MMSGCSEEYDLSRRLPSSCQVIIFLSMLHLECHVYQLVKTRAFCDELFVILRIVTYHFTDFLRHHEYMIWCKRLTSINLQMKAETVKNWVFLHLISFLTN